MLNVSDFGNMVIMIFYFTVVMGKHRCIKDKYVLCYVEIHDLMGKKLKFHFRARHMVMSFALFLFEFEV